MSEVTGFISYKGIHAEEFTAADTLLIGDVVYMDTDGEVDKATTAGNYATYIGVVVGGERTYMKILQDDLDIGSPAAEAGEKVLVAIAGVVKVVADAVIATPGLRISAATATTAGRVKTAVTTEFMVGVNLDAAAAEGDILRMLIFHPTTASVFS